MAIMRNFNHREEKMSYFYEFESKRSSHRYHAYLMGYDGIYTDIIPEDRLLFGDYEGFNFPLVFKHNNQHKPLDILDTGTVSLYLVSERMINILEENELTGWKKFPIKLIDKKNKEIFGYCGFSVVGRCGRIEYNTSREYYEEIYEGGPLDIYYIGEYFDVGTWDGSDFFISKGQLRTLVTQKVVNVLKKHQLSNLKFTNLNDSKISQSDVRYSLERRAMEDELCREPIFHLGESLDSTAEIIDVIHLKCPHCLQIWQSCSKGPVVACPYCKIKEFNPRFLSAEKK